MNPLNYLRRLRHDAEGRLLTLIEARVGHALSQFAETLRVDREIRRKEKRLCGVMVFGRTVTSPADAAPDLSVDFAPDFVLPERRPRPRMPPIVSPLVGALSTLLQPDEEHVFQLRPQVVIGPSALVVAWGCCELVELCVGTEIANAWPGNGLALIAPPSSVYPGTLIQARVKGWPP